jgi:hypothetical protein
VGGVWATAAVDLDESRVRSALADDGRGSVMMWGYKIGSPMCGPTREDRAVGSGGKG